MQALEAMRPIGAIHATAGMGAGDHAAWPQVTCGELSGQIQTEILAGRLALQCCLILGAPLTLHALPDVDAPLRPIKLTCCGFTVSAGGVWKLLSRPWRKCQFCNASLVKGGALQEDRLTAAAVAAESHGFAPRVFASADVTVAAGSAADDEEACGTANFGGTVGWTQVALTRLPLSKAEAGPMERVGVRQAAAPPYLAGLASPFVRKLYGYCWKDASLWCAHTPLHLFDLAVLHVRANGAPHFSRCPAVTRAVPGADVTPSGRFGGAAGNICHPSGSARRVAALRQLSCPHLPVRDDRACSAPALASVFCMPRCGRRSGRRGAAVHRSTATLAARLRCGQWGVATGGPRAGVCTAPTVLSTVLLVT